jgi:hypothetical protein
LAGLLPRHHDDKPSSDSMMTDGRAEWRLIAVCPKSRIHFELISQKDKGKIEKTEGKGLLREPR